MSIANPKYNTVKHKYELTFNEDSEIHEVKDDGEIKIQKKISLVNLRDIKIATKETPFTADLIGIVKHIGTVSNLKTKQGNDIAKQNIIIVDDTKHSFEISFWDSNVNLIKEEIVESQNFHSHFFYNLQWSFYFKITLAIILSYIYKYIHISVISC